jgi:hypothetical protein
MKPKKDNDGKPRRNLELRRATLRKLTADQLQAPVGGLSATICPTSICPTVPVTARCPGTGY